MANCTLIEQIYSVIVWNGFWLFFIHRNKMIAYFIVLVIFYELLYIYAYAYMYVWVRLHA